MSKRFSEEERQRWKEYVLKQQGSGLSIERWCQLNGIKSYQLHYWKGKFQPVKQLSCASFTELAHQEKQVGLFFECNGIRLHVEYVSDPSLLKQCLKALRESAC